MQDLAEIVSKRQFLLGETDIPDISYKLGVYIKATNDELIFFWDNSNTMEELMYEKQEFEFKIKKCDILTIKQLIKQPINENDYSFTTDNYPELQITHKDPYGVVEFFTTRFRNSENYWIKALAKYLSHQLDIPLE